MTPEFRYAVEAERVAARAWFLEQTDGRCSACGLSLAGLWYEPIVDHNHVTGLARGVLCQSCNSAMWAFDRGMGNAQKYPHLVGYAQRVGIESMGEISMEVRELPVLAAPGSPERWLLDVIHDEQEPPVEVHTEVWWEWWFHQNPGAAASPARAAAYADWKLRRVPALKKAKNCPQWQASPAGLDFAKRRAEAKESQVAAKQWQATEGVKRHHADRDVLSRLPECAGAVWMDLEDQARREYLAWEAVTDERIIYANNWNWHEPLDAIRATWWDHTRLSYEQAVADVQLSTHVYWGSHSNLVLDRARAMPSVIPAEMYPPRCAGYQCGAWAVLVLDPYLKAHPEIDRLIAWAQYDIWAGGRGNTMHEDAARITISDMPPSMSMDQWVKLWEDSSSALYREAQRVRVAARGGRIAHSKFVLIDRDGSDCKICGEPVPIADVHIDHVVPFSRGGADVMENLQVACSHCNLSKHDSWAGSRDHDRLRAALAVSPTYTGEVHYL